MQTKMARYTANPEMYFRYAVLSLNSKCNSNCLNCTGKVTNREDIPFNTAKKIFDVLISKCNINEIYPSCAAEMTLLPYLNDLIKYIDSIRHRNTKILQDTNGRYIPDGFIDTLNNAELAYIISISVWSSDQTTLDSLQGGGSFDTIKTNIETYLSELKFPPCFSIPYINKDQYSKTEKLIIDLITKAGYKYIVHDGGPISFIYSSLERGIIPIYKRKYFADTKAYYNGEGYKYIDHGNCWSLFRAICIDSEGDVYPCGGMYNNKETSIGNILDYEHFTYDTLKEMLHCDIAKRYLEDNFTANKFACEKYCKKCAYRIGG